MAFLENPVLQQFILPFILIFVLVFAVLKKSAILGAKELDTLVALAIGLIVILFPDARLFVVGIMPWLVMALSVLLVFYLILTLATGSNALPDSLKKVFIALTFIFTIAVVLNLTGKLWWVESFFSTEIWTNLLLIGSIVAVVWIVAKSGSAAPGNH
jgi:hypothetical protein